MSTGLRRLTIAIVQSSVPSASVAVSESRIPPLPRELAFLANAIKRPVNLPLCRVREPVDAQHRRQWLRRRGHRISSRQHVFHSRV